jgi:hypothetical protein
LQSPPHKVSPSTTPQPVSGFPPIAAVLWDCRENRASRAWMLTKLIDALFFRRPYCRSHKLLRRVQFRVNFFNDHLVIADYLVVYPSPAGDHLAIADYHDPGEALASILIEANQILFVKFD